MNFPLVPVPSQPVDSSLGQVPFNYAVLGEESTPKYPSLEDAVAGNNEVGHIEAGNLRYVSYIDYADTERGRFFKLHDNTWVRVSSRISVPHSYLGGIKLIRTPNISFGWILPFGPTQEAKRTPGYKQADYTGHSYNQYQLIQVYATETINDTEWYLVGPDEWIEGLSVGYPNHDPAT
jgi:hypothetical protein